MVYVCMIRISQEMEENKRLPLTLARTGSVGLSHNSISKKIGKLFIERNNVNLHFDVLDTPEFFWEQVYHIRYCVCVDVIALI